MSMTCNRKWCTRQCVSGTPYCQVHLADHILTAISTDKHLYASIKQQLFRPFTRAERLILVLTYGSPSPMSTWEIAATLDLAESTIRRKLHLILERTSLHLQKFSEILYPFSPNVEDQVITGICEFNDELITYLAKHPNELYHFDPRKFERLIAHIMRSLGFEVELTAPVRDGGCDIIAFNADNLGIRTKYVVECKRYRQDRPVGVELVRSLYGVKLQNQAEHAVLATTSYFTRGAIHFAKDPEVLNLHLKDLTEIRKLLKVCPVNKPDDIFPDR